MKTYSDMELSGLIKMKTAVQDGLVDESLDALTKKIALLRFEQLEQFLLPYVDRLSSSVLYVYDMIETRDEQRAWTRYDEPVALVPRLASESGYAMTWELALQTGYPTAIISHSLTDEARLSVAMEGIPLPSSLCVGFDVDMQE